MRTFQRVTQTGERSAALARPAAGFSPAPIQRLLHLQGLADASRPRQVIQRAATEAQKYISENGIVGVKAKKKDINRYVRDRSKPQHLRYGLRDAWNIGSGKGQTISYSDDIADSGAASHHAKVEKETSNKAEGDSILKSALDQYGSQHYSGVVSILGFRLCGHKHGIAVAISRSTGKAESKAMKSSESVERTDHADRFKWFSEAQAHTAKFVNYSSTDTGSSLIIWLDATGYLRLRSGLVHEFGSSGLALNRFHQENVSSFAHLINVGIHPDFDGDFAAMVIDVKDLQKLGSPREEELLFGTEEQEQEHQAAVQPPGRRTMPNELLYAHAAGFQSFGEMEEWRQSDAFFWYQDMIETFGPVIPPARRDALLRRFREEFQRD